MEYPMQAVRFLLSGILGSTSIVGALLVVDIALVVCETLGELFRKWGVHERHNATIRNQAWRLT